MPTSAEFSASANLSAMGYAAAFRPRTADRPKSARELDDMAVLRLAAQQHTARPARRDHEIEIGPLDFTLPPELEADAPPEARGAGRDDVRLMVSYQADNRVVHARFPQIGDFLRAGDLLVTNTSGTLNVALCVARTHRTP